MMFLLAILAGIIGGFIGAVSAAILKKVYYWAIGGEPENKDNKRK